MKYYKLIKNPEQYPSYTLNKIYLENYSAEGRACTVLDYYNSFLNQKNWIKVPAGEYFVQEGKMPEYFAIKKVEDNPLWEKYIDWLIQTYKIIGRFDGSAKFYGYIGSTNPNTIFENSIEYIINNPIELTLEQWGKIVNKKEEVMDKEIIGWKLKEDCKKYEQAALNIVNQSKFYNFAEGYNFETNSTNENALKKAGVLELWFEPVYKEEFKVGDWVTFYSETNQCTYTDKIKDWTCHSYCRLGQGLEPFKHLLRKATPEEIKAAQTLQFGGYDVTFEKVTSGVRITCNGETGTLSQVEAIYNYFKPNSTYFKFGSQEVKKITYGQNDSWNLENESDNPTEIKIGCTTGTWKEFVAIYEKAKSML